MPNKKAAEKSLRQSKKSTERNQNVLRTLKNLSKDFVTAKAAGKTTVEMERQLQQAYDKAAKTGAVKKNNAARKKSRLFKTKKAAK